MCWLLQTVKEQSRFVFSWLKPIFFTQSINLFSHTGYFKLFQIRASCRWYNVPPPLPHRYSNSSDCPQHLLRATELSSAALRLVKDQSDAASAQWACWIMKPDGRAEINGTCLILLSYAFWDGSKDLWAVHQYSRTTCPVILRQQNEDLAWAQHETKVFRKHLCFFLHICYNRTPLYGFRWNHKLHFCFVFFFNEAVAFEGTSSQTLLVWCIFLFKGQSTRLNDMQKCLHMKLFNPPPPTPLTVCQCVLSPLCVILLCFSDWEKPVLINITWLSFCQAYRHFIVWLKSVQL